MSKTISLPTRGFTLIELLIVVAIVAIIAAVAIPSYQRYVQQSRRQEAQQTLLTLAQQEERSFARTGAYISLTMPTSNSYTFSVVFTPSTYTLTAAPKNGQSSDSCGTMTLNQKTETTAAQTDCWR